MATPANVAALQKKAKKLQADIDDLKKCCKQVEKWIKAQVKWNAEVTGMLRGVNWAKLEKDYPGGGNTNPPQTPPSWPPA